MNKKSTFLLTIALIFVFLNINSFGQITLFGGASVPIGAFGGTVLTNKDDGFAKLGFNVGLQNDYKVGKSVNWCTSAMVSINSFDQAEMERQFGGIKVDGGNYYTYWLLSGLGFDTQVSDNLFVYFQGQAGLLFSKMPDITLSYGGNSADQTAKMATTFAFGLGAGAKINKINLSVKYFYGKPEYEQVATSGNLMSSVKVSLPASILSFDVGYIF